MVINQLSDIGMLTTSQRRQSDLMGRLSLLLQMAATCGVIFIQMKNVWVVIILRILPTTVLSMRQKSESMGVNSFAASNLVHDGWVRFDYVNDSK